MCSQSQSVSDKWIPVPSLGINQKLCPRSQSVPEKKSPGDGQSTGLEVGTGPIPFSPFPASIPDHNFIFFHLSDFIVARLFTLFFSRNFLSLKLSA